MYLNAMHSPAFGEEMQQEPRSVMPVGSTTRYQPKFLLLIPLEHRILVSSDRSSYSDSVLLLVRARQQLFQILSISANIFSFSC